MSKDFIYIFLPSMENFSFAELLHSGAGLKLSQQSPVNGEWFYHHSAPHGFRTPSD
jgi:hypothetical protein